MLPLPRSSIDSRRPIRTSSHEIRRRPRRLPRRPAARRLQHEFFQVPRPRPAGHAQSTSASPRARALRALAHVPLGRLLLDISALPPRHLPRGLFRKVKHHKDRRIPRRAAVPDHCPRWLVRRFARPVSTLHTPKKQQQQSSNLPFLPSRIPNPAVHLQSGHRVLCAQRKRPRLTNHDDSCRCGARCETAAGYLVGWLPPLTLTLFQLMPVPLFSFCLYLNPTTSVVHRKY